MRLVTALSGAALALAVMVPAPAGADAVDERRTFSSPQGALDYRVHVPEHTAPIPLLVYLHGCGAPPSVPGLDAMADTLGFAVAYPIQPLTSNDGCWPWTSAADQHRDRGEPALIAGVTREVTAAEGIDPHRIYVAGHSAGSGMTAIMAAAYPDLYEAAGLIAGCGKLTCFDVTGLSPYAEMGPRARAMPVYLLWGTADTTNPYLTGRLQLLQWLGMNDLADDRLLNLSVPRLPTSLRSYPAVGSTPSYVVETYGPDVSFVSVKGMGHVPDATWKPAFPDLVAFLLAH